MPEGKPEPLRFSSNMCALTAQMTSCNNEEVNTDVGDGLTSSKARPQITC